MALVRFSSDNWRSDVYVYEAAEGWTIHIACNRLVGNVPEVPSIFSIPLKGNPGHEEALKEWLKKHQEQMDWLENAERKEIGGHFDGETRFGLTAEEAAAELKQIKKAGYCVPDGVIELLQKEAQELRLRDKEKE